MNKNLEAQKTDLTSVTKRGFDDRHTNVQKSACVCPSEKAPCLSPDCFKCYK